MDPSKPLSFTKMQGAGNDFIVHDLRSSDWTVDQFIEWAPTLCDRRYGIGADGIILLAKSDKADYRMIYRNADGSDAGMCGNGGRCIALYAKEKGFDRTQRFEVHQQVYKAIIENDQEVTLNFPAESRVDPLPDFVKGYQVNPGTEHIVLPVEQEELQDENLLRTRGRELRNHSFFQPIGTNVNFMYAIDQQSLRLQTYERGVENLTLACGTGAMASALVCHHLYSKNSDTYTYQVLTEGGKLEVTFTFDSSTGIYSNLKLGGPAHFVFEGTIQR